MSRAAAAAAGRHRAGRAPARGPQLSLADDDDDDDDLSQSGTEEDEVDSDVERLAAESIDRRRRAAIDSAVAAAEGKVRKEGTAALEQARIDFEQELAALQQEHATYRQHSEAALQKARREGESMAGARLEAIRSMEAAEARAAALEERLVSCEAERDELETGILHARDICAQKEEEAKEASMRVSDEALAKVKAEAEAALSEKHAAELTEAIATATRAAETRAADAVAAEAAASLAAQERLKAYCEQLEAALLTARELATRREEQLCELEERAGLAVKLAIEQTTKRLEATYEARQRMAMSAAMSAATSAQKRAVAAALASEREAYARADKAAEARRQAQQKEAASSEYAATLATVSPAESVQVPSHADELEVKRSSADGAPTLPSTSDTAGAEPRVALSVGQSEAVERALAEARAKAAEGAGEP